MKKIIIFSLFLLLVLSSCTTTKDEDGIFYSKNDLVNDVSDEFGFEFDNYTIIKENMILACEMEFCSTELWENDKQILVLCTCPTGELVSTKFIKSSKEYIAKQVN